MHWLGHKQARELEGTFGAAEVVDIVASDGGIQRCATLFPVREQLVKRTGFENGTRQNMGTDFRPFFEDTDTDLLAGLLRQLQQATCCSKTGRPRSHDNDIDFHGFALHHSGSPSAHQKTGGIMINHPAKRKAWTLLQIDTMLSQYQEMPSD